ncbi:prolyl 4-hydroxylase alpha-subunit [Fragilaria crotonensis]|nr:prolyl 4-hydroxylase alpha-subunit [Fragilaria crotonensis]
MPASTLSELGLLEWWRLSDYRQRVTTVILYLNEPDRQESDGGMLRCWANPKDREESFDIVPKGGTLVIFQSDLVEHMVLPSSVDRYALTNWVSETRT